MVIDKKVAELEKLDMGSGDHLKGIELALEDLLSLLPECRFEEIAE